MPYKSFLIPIQASEAAEHELNKFVRSHRVLAVDRRWVDQGENSFWAVWVDYLDASSESSTSAANSGGRKKVDYKEVLSPEDFEIFAKLRVLRKEMATEDGVALYTVFTNEQLAQIVQGRVRTQAELQRIAGIGKSRAEKYGPRALELVKTIWKEADEEGGEATGTGP